MTEQKTVQISFAISKYYKDLFKFVSDYYEMSYVDLLKKWIYDEAVTIIEPLTDDYEPGDDDLPSTLDQAKKVVIGVIVDQIDEQEALEASKS